jgi:epsilon-lactone hydrolase
MPSIRAQLLICLLRHRHLLRLQSRKPTVDRNTSVLELRAKAERGAARLGGSLRAVRLQPEKVGAIAAEWIEPVGGDDNRTILYFHGGGYVMGSLASHRGVIAKFVRATETRALHFEYRLAPENPFPAAIEDAVAAHSWLLAQGVPPERIVFLGDSAGGGLCLATLLTLRDRGTALPAAAAAMSPWTDLKCTGRSYDREDDLAPTGSWQVFSSYYAGANPTDHPLISPLYGDLAGLPPLFLCAGEAESMADDSVRFAEKAKAAGVQVHLLLGRGMIHCYPAFSPLFPEAKQAFDEVCSFLQRQLGLHRGDA